MSTIKHNRQKYLYNAINIRASVLTVFFCRNKFFDQNLVIALTAFTNTVNRTMQEAYKHSIKRLDRPLYMSILLFDYKY